MISQFEVESIRPSKIEVVAITNSLPTSKANKHIRNSQKLGKSSNYIGIVYPKQQPQQRTDLAEDSFEMGEIERAIYAKIVKKCGNRLDNEKERKEFWDLLRKHMEEKGVCRNPQQPKTGLYTLDLVQWGVHGVYLKNSIPPSGNYLEIMVFLNNTQCKPSVDVFFNELFKYKDSIETLLGGIALDWENDEEKKGKRVSLKYKFDFRNQKKWNEGIDWLIDMMEQFHKILSPIVLQIKEKFQ